MRLLFQYPDQTKGKAAHFSCSISMTVIQRTSDITQSSSEIILLLSMKNGINSEAWDWFPDVEEILTIPWYCIGKVFQTSSIHIQNTSMLQSNFVCLFVRLRATICLPQMSSLSMCLQSTFSTELLLQFCEFIKQDRKMRMLFIFQNFVNFLRLCF